MPRFDLSTIGEGQIRLTCHKGDRLVTASELRMTAACSEANVSGLLSQLGRETSWASVMPKGELSERVLSEFRSVGVHLENIVRKDSGRVALYFMEPGEYPMPARVIYDRLFTPFRNAEIEDFDWESMLDTRLVFVTGITAALTENTAKIVRYFVDQAVERGIDVALDVNYRSLLWDPESARATLEPIARKSSIVFCSRSDGTAIFGLPGDGMDVCRSLRDELEAPVVVSTDQINGVFMASLSADKEFDVVQVPVVDRPGAGDSFVAGTLHGFLDGDVESGIRYGLRTSSFALTHHGDLTHVAPHELNLPETTDILR
jgi:Sugar kinases, ribokinase family